MLVALSTELDSRKSFVVAFSAAALWATLPINVSANLIAVQRMTTLSAFFGLLGLCVFVSAYYMQHSRPVVALSIQVGALFWGTLLAVYSKENGALIPVFALVINATLLKRVPIENKYALVRGILLWSGLVAIFVYLSPAFQNWFSIDTYRGYSAWSRFLEQPRILIQYLASGFSPLPTQFSPFHDDVRLQATVPQFLACVGVWVLVVLAALRLRRYSQWPLFAVLWFLTGHLLESSVINLELYFEHRNYLALFGMCLALSYFVWDAPGGLSRIMPGLYAAYVGVIASVLFFTVNLWGSPMRAAETWVDVKPKSSRAALHLATLDIQEKAGDGLASQRSLVSAAKRDRVVSFLDKTIDSCPKCVDVKLQALLYACDIRRKEELAVRFNSLLDVANRGYASSSVVDGLFPLVQLAKHRACGPITIESVEELVSAFIENPAFSAQTYQVRLYFLAANVAYEKGGYHEALQYLKNGEHAGPHALPILQFQVHVLLELDRVEDALSAIERRRSLAGKHHKMDNSVLDMLKQEILKPENEEKM
jgi:hypothetical protein